MEDALSNAMTTAAPWLVVSSAAVYGAHSYWPAFRKSYGASGLASLVIMPPEPSVRGRRSMRMLSAAGPPTFIR